MAFAKLARNSLAAAVLEIIGASDGSPRGAVAAFTHEAAFHSATRTSDKVVIGLLVLALPKCGSDAVIARFANLVAFQGHVVLTAICAGCDAANAIKFTLKRNGAHGGWQGQKQTKS